MNSIKVGDRIPSFSLPDQDGVLVDAGLLIGKKKMVIFFYPKDDSPGCTKEACYFRDLYEARR
jgi:peroxiredoxin Q/BCP